MVTLGILGLVVVDISPNKFSTTLLELTIPRGLVGLSYLKDIVRAHSLFLEYERQIDVETQVHFLGCTWDIGKRVSHQIDILWFHTYNSPEPRDLG